LREWTFFTDARTFRERYTLVKDRGIAGILLLGSREEDAAIWELLPSHK